MKQRNNGLDLLRILSAIAVVLIHINARYFLENCQTDGFNYFIEQIFNLLTRFSVPCFIMLSGAFVLKDSRNIDFGYFYKKTFLKIGIPYIGISIIWIVLLFYIDCIENNNFMSFFWQLLQVSYGNLWFMPMLIGLYLMVPFLIRMINSVDRKVLFITTVVMTVWSVISQSATNYILPYSIGVVFSYMSYFLLGYLLNIYKISASAKGCLGGLSVIMLIAAVALRQNGLDIYLSNPFKAFFSPAVVVFSCFLFAIFKDLQLKTNYSVIANYTYYVYLIHTIVYSTLFVVVEKILGINLNEVVCIIIYTIITTVISFACAVVYKKICGMFVQKIER